MTSRGLLRRAPSSGAGESLKFEIASGGRLWAGQQSADDGDERRDLDAHQPNELPRHFVVQGVDTPVHTETRGQFFPVKDADGRSWVVYTSNESGEYEIYVESYPRGTQKDRVSTRGGTQPRWRKDGKELFYISPDLKLMAVPVTWKGQRLEFGSPVELFQTRISLGGTLAYRMLRYDVTRDGQRFLINSEPPSAPPSSSAITVVLNWPALLEK